MASPFPKNKKNKDMGKDKNKKEVKVVLGLGNMITGVILFFIVLSAAYSLIGEKKSKVADVAISTLASEVIKGEVKTIGVSSDKITIERTDGVKQKSKKEPSASLVETLTSYGVTPEQLAAVEISVENESGIGYWIVSLLPIVLPILLIFGFLWFLSRQMKGSGMQAFTFGQSKAKLTDPNDKNNRVTFADVAGNKEAKQELLEIVDFLRNPKKFLDIGAQIPKGVMLTGAPGTGKTLLARAVAGEASVPFFHLSGSEFVEMFVGVGASRVRDLFQMAKRASPAIVFIDEIDAVGRVRGTGVGGGNDEREQTLNQILVEMDGFEPNEKVIVIAATNRNDVLDPALLRPGRFDRRVMLDLPDLADREEILKIHARKKPFAEDVKLRLIAERTPGFSGADLYSLMNEGAILAARENRTTVAQTDLIRSIEKVIMGPERSSHLLSKKEKEITAYHEAGHAIVSSVLEYADPVHKVTIISRGRAAGYTLKLPLEEKKLQAKKEFLDDLAVSMGGYAAEQLVFGDITTGPSNDLQVATGLARAMVTRWGMSDVIGPMALESDGGRAMFGDGINDDVLSKSSSGKISVEVKKILDEALVRANAVLADHRGAFDAIAKKLIEVETLEQAEYEVILQKHGIPLKKLPETKSATL